MKLQEKNGQYFITIRKSIVKDKGWKKGQELVMEYNAQGKVEIREAGK